MEHSCNASNLQSLQQGTWDCSMARTARCCHAMSHFFRLEPPGAGAGCELLLSRGLEADFSLSRSLSRLKH